MTPARIVLDASAFLRAAHGESAVAAQLLSAIEHGATRAHAPDLIGAETAHALLRLARSGRVERGRVEDTLVILERLALRRHSTIDLGRTAFDLAIDTGLSSYDACYAVLAEALDVPLVTADRKLASAVGNAIIV